MSESGKLFWLVSVPKTEGNQFDELDKATTRDSSLSTVNSKFAIPKLKVGNIDSLISLSDALKKVNVTVEQTLRKIAAQYYDLQKDPNDKDDKKKLKKKEIEVRGASAETYLLKFRWDDARYGRKKSLPELTQLIKGQIATTEKELREKSMEYNIVCQKLAQISQNESGSLLTRDLAKDLASFTATESEYLTTLYVVVPKAELKNWKAQYETLTHYVVPRSSVMISQDSDYALMSVVLFQKVVEEFKNAARMKRFTVRKLDPSTSLSEDEKNNLVEKQQKLRQSLERWALTHFGEAFLAWLHLKCIQCFVESILRFGLPAEFESMLLMPKKGQEKKLEKTLCKLYQHLSRDFDQDDKELDQAEESKVALLGVEKFFPYVFLDINIDFAK